MSITDVLRRKIKGLRQIMQFDNRWHLAMSRAVFREPINVYRLGSIVFLEDHSAGDANGARDVLTGEMYRPFLDRLALPRSLRVLDLGASNGGFPLLLKSMGFALSRIVAVEMHPRTFRRLRFNIEANFDCERSLINAAVAGHDGSITLHLGPGSTGDSVLTPKDGGTQVSVPAITLDRLIDQSSIDLIKMDIEGAEFDVFDSNTYRSIEQCRYFIAEIHPEYGNPLAVVDRLRQSGFERLDVANRRDGIYCFVNKNCAV